MRLIALVLVLLVAPHSGLLIRAAVAAPPDAYPAMPAEVVKAMLAAANAQDFDKAKSYTDGFIDGEEILRKKNGGIKEYWRNLLHDFTYTDLEVLTEKDAGGEHIVRSLLHYADKKQTFVGWHMKQIDGKWKVVNT